MVDVPQKTTSFLLVKKLHIRRSSCPDVFCKKSVLRISQNSYLCHSFFLNKDAGLSLQLLLKKRLWHRCFPVNCAKFLRTPFLKEHIRWLLLFMYFHENKGRYYYVGLRKENVLYWSLKDQDFFKNHFPLITCSSSLDSIWGNSFI